MKKGATADQKTPAERSMLRYGSCRHAIDGRFDWDEASCAKRRK